MSFVDVPYPIGGSIDIVARIIPKVYRDVVAVLRTGEVHRLLLNVGAEPVGNSPGQFELLPAAETVSMKVAN